MTKEIVKVVTVTGADDSVQPEELISVAKEYPFVEFGILLSMKQQGNKRFPSRDWLEKLYALFLRNELVLSGHLCGSWVRDLCLGKPSFFDEFGYKWVMFERLQLNFHAEPHPINDKAFGGLIRHCLEAKPLIFQMDGVNEGIFHFMEERWGNSKIYQLFDTSGGCGQLPDRWPKQSNGYCGYAGGLSPGNVQNELRVISEVASGPIWIDAETLLRSEDDKLFDLKKVRQFLEEARPWVIHS